jgi:hypothetical protein
VAAVSHADTKRASGLAPRGGRGVTLQRRAVALIEARQRAQYLSARDDVAHVVCVWYCPRSSRASFSGEAYLGGPLECNRHPHYRIKRWDSPCAVTRADATLASYAYTRCALCDG